jgi:hypothetical protein
MAKGVTEDDLASGIRSMGGLGTLSRNRRDSPFRDTREEEVPAVKTVELPLQKEVPSAAVEVRSEVRGEPARVVKAERPREVEKPIPVEKPVRNERKKAPQRKADIYSERVTLQMSPEMRDEVDELARQLQRAKTSKDERITANTVMRVAIQAFLEAFDLDPKSCPNSEKELLDVARTQKRK